MRRPGQPTIDIPILMEAVADTPAPPVEAVPGEHGRRSLAREDQQALFAELPPPAGPVKRRPPPTPAERLRAAREMLKLRAPAIIEEVVGAHRQQLVADLRARLQQELAALLADLDPPSPPD